MYFCIKSTQGCWCVRVFPARSRNGEKLFPLTCRGGERGAVRGHENVTLLCVSVEAQFASLNINPSSLSIASLSYTLKGHPGPCPDKEFFFSVVSFKSLLVLGVS